MLDCARRQLHQIAFYGCESARKLNFDSDRHLDGLRAHIYR